MQQDQITNIRPVTAPARRGAGRPRNFDPEAALRAALDAFWTNGYERTSLDDLNRVMGISRSSSYACFGSKHETLLHALRLYAADSLIRLRGAMEPFPDPQAKLRALILELGDIEGGRRGCFLANCITELAVSDPEVDAIIQGQFADVEALMHPPLRALGDGDVVHRAQLLLAMALGVVALRKAGIAPETLGTLLCDGVRTLLLPARD